MKRILLLNLICFGTLGLQAQIRLADSLKQVLNQHTEKDTQKVMLYNVIAYELSKSHPESGLLYADSAIAVARSIRNLKLEKRGWGNKAINYSAIGQDSLAMIIYLRLLEYYDTANDNFEKANIYHRISILNFNQADYISALNYLTKALNIFIQYPDSEKIAGCYNSIGVNHMRLGNYPEAIDYFLKAKLIYEKNNNREQTAMVLSNIGLVYQYMDEPLKDLEYQRAALSVYSELDLKQGIINCLGNIGNTYDNLDSLDLALSFYRQSVELAKKYHFPRNIASGLTNSAGVFIQQKAYRKAFDALTEAISFYERSGDHSAVSVAYSFLADLFTEASAADLKKSGFQVTDKDKLARKYYYSALEAAGKAKDKTKIYHALIALSNYYKEKSDYQNSLYLYERAMSLRDSIQNDRKKREIERLQLQAEFDKREALLLAEHSKETAAVEAEIQRVKLMRTFIAGMGVLAVAGGLLVFIQYKKRRDISESKHNAELRAEMTEMEMKALRSQMNPHFIFNALNSINDSIQKLDAEKASLFTIRFGRLMRMILENSEHKEVPLVDDLAALDMYLQVERLRLNDKFDYTILVDSSINQSSVLIPPLLLQPFAENSIWHGISSKPERGQITITIDRVGEMMRCCIEDDGIGRMNQNLSGTGNGRRSLGIKITEHRISLLNRTRNTQATYFITDLQNGVRAEILLPLIYDELIT
ncbi:MAG: tetratricopeptide repeat protein [Bacteroidia bacterium]|nr:tetratricopeptide repeat protein [Bacteroidia bacterium]MCZ2276846.1 tetratricopeptide repeat protein [Bacteroidia bacterium]